MEIICSDTKELVHNYKEYLKTNHWMIMKCKYAQKYKKACVLCGYDKMIQVHHTNYKNLGNESFDDLVYLCKDCHNRLHETVGKSETKELGSLKEKFNIKAKSKKKKIKCTNCIDCHRNKCVSGYSNTNGNCAKFKKKIKKKL